MSAQPAGSTGPVDPEGRERGELLDLLERELGVLLRRSKRVLTERGAAVHPDLPGAAYLLLMAVHRQGGVRSADLAEHFSVDKASISRQVQQLLDLDLLQRHADPEDRRAWLLSTTEHAQRRLRAVEQQRRERLDSSLAGWDDEDLARFTGLLCRYNESLEQGDRATP